MSSEDAAKQDAQFEDPNDRASNALFAFLATDGPEPSLCAATGADGRMKIMVFYDIDSAREYIPQMKRVAKVTKRPIQLQRFDFGRVVCHILPGCGTDE